MEEEYLKWLKQAEADYDTAKYNLNGKRIDSGLFFLQQSAEKALKALYIKNFKELLKIHDLFILGKKLNAPKEIIQFCKELSPAYQYTRYPDVPKIKNINFEKYVVYAEEILKWVKKKI